MTDTRFPRLSTLLAAVVALVFAVPGIAGAQSPQDILNDLSPQQREEAARLLSEQMAGDTPSQLTPDGTMREPVSAPLSPVRMVEQESPAVVRTNSVLIIEFLPRTTLTPDELLLLEDDDVYQRLLGSNRYEVDDSGAISLFGLVSVPLLGLGQNEVEKALEAEPLLRPLDASVRILQLDTDPAADIEPYGYALFESNEAGFEPPMTGPVPSDYIIGPGDVVQVQLFGNESRYFEIEVTREGQANIPLLGPLSVSGLPFSAVRDELQRRVDESLIGTTVSVTMGALRTIRVFVLGDVNRPGSYVVGGMATISSALYRTGGVSQVGSLRSVELKRRGETVGTLDLYDFLLRGDTRNDLRLQDGDVIFVPPVGKQVSIYGAVRRPAIYELRDEVSVRDVLGLAGGLSADSYPDGTQVERISDRRERTMIGLGAAYSSGSEFRFNDGDVVRVPRVLPDIRGVVNLAGRAFRTGAYQWFDGMRVIDLVGSLELLEEDADLNYALIRREDPVSRRLSVFSVDIAAALAAPGGTDNAVLESGDTLILLPESLGRQKRVQSVLDELRSQTSVDDPHPVVTINGAINARGQYPLETGMRVSDLLVAGGGLSESAFRIKAELFRYTTGTAKRETDVVDLDLNAINRGDSSADVVLQPHDVLRVSALPEWNALRTVELVGEVLYPGEYRIREGETLGDLLERAGGVTQDAYPGGSVFLRESVKANEREQLAILTDRLEAELITLGLSTGAAQQAGNLAAQQSVLQKIKDAEPVGRLVIDLEASLAGDGRATDIELRDGDRLLIPKRPQFVMVMGETQRTAAHLYDDRASVADYLQKSGGFTRSADKKNLYIVRADGSIEASRGSAWLARNGVMNLRLEPGDTIVVPQFLGRARQLDVWRGVSQVLYQLSISIAAIQSFND